MKNWQKASIKFLLTPFLHQRKNHYTQYLWNSSIAEKYPTDISTTVRIPEHTLAISWNMYEKLLFSSMKGGISDISCIICGDFFRCEFSKNPIFVWHLNCSKNMAWSAVLFFGRDGRILLHHERGGGGLGIYFLICIIIRLAQHLVS